VTLAACFAHVRRRFYELHVNESSQLATQTVTTMAGLWEIEADIRGQDPATRGKVRQERSAAIVAALFDLWDKKLPRLSGKTKLAEAIRYATFRRAALERFLSDGRIEINSNTVERAIRPQTKCALRGQPRRGPDLGDHRHPAADREDIDPHAWLTQTLERIAQGWRCSHALALQSLNGLSLALTKEHEAGAKTADLARKHGGSTKQSSRVGNRGRHRKKKMRLKAPDIICANRLGRP
jgi:transposase